MRGLIIFTVVAVVVGNNYRSVLVATGRILGIVFPFLLGAAMAFVFNVPMRRIEKLLPMKENNRLKRPLSLVLTLAFVTGILLLVIFVVVPQLRDTLISLQNSVPVFLEGVRKGAESLFASYSGSVWDFDSLQIDWNGLVGGVFSFLSSGAGSVLSSTFTVAVSIINGVTTFGIAMIFSLYILLQKESLARQIKKTVRAFAPDHISTVIFDIAALTERTFSNFLTGQCVEAVILGTMFFITLTVLRLPYALLIGVLIAFTALIPVFGALIGCAVGIFLMLMVSPMQALIFTVVFFVLQQIEGNLIYPHVVGNSVGLPSIWVLVAVTIGGSAMGLVGMLIFIPLCSVLYTLLRGIVNRRLELKERKIPKTKNKPVSR